MDDDTRSDNVVELVHSSKGGASKEDSGGTFVAHDYEIVFKDQTTKTVRANHCTYNPRFGMLTFLETLPDEADYGRLIELVNPLEIKHVTLHEVTDGKEEAE